MSSINHLILFIGTYFLFVVMDFQRILAYESAPCLVGSSVNGSILLRSFQHQAYLKLHHLRCLQHYSHRKIYYLYFSLFGLLEVICFLCFVLSEFKFLFALSSFFNGPIRSSSFTDSSSLTFLSM